MTLAGWAGVALTLIVTTREQTKSLKQGQADLKSEMVEGQGETLRQVKAVHSRLDDYGKRIQHAEVRHAVLVERVENIRDTQRMRRARLEAEQVGETPMFIVDEGGGGE
jgi:hypothetical protein